ncbi:helix-turn-helix domain-containing protein [Sinorhizobium meliloti]|uniref:helix-turn-helix domain-containing protein n=1 Tax=Rhizobium meliloti TaxID=382 RepID=UPI0003DDB2B9|nr:helix-turn-helix domain-containing protein [Sinorhizobium meliloti]
MKNTTITLEKSIDCPCCAQKVRAPSLEIVVDHYGVPPLEARILAAVWKGKGMPISAERIFDSMYHDDPDGGPSPTAMYRALKVTLFHLRERMDGTGITVENCGYRAGYRLVIGREAHRTDQARKRARLRDKTNQNFEVRNAESS